MKRYSHIGCMTYATFTIGILALLYCVGFGIWARNWFFETERLIVICGFAFSALFLGLALLLEKRDKKIAQENEERQEVLKQKRRIACEEYEKTLSDLSNKFGECTINENLGGWHEYRIASRVLIYEQSSVIIIKSKVFKFSDILGCSLVDDATSETITTSAGTVKTSTGSMLGRAVVGGALIGGLGAVTGAVTAKKNISNNATSQTATTHNYRLYINVNSLQEPTISLKIGDDTLKAQKIAGVLNIIVERNKQSEK